MGAVAMSMIISKTLCIPDETSLVVGGIDRNASGPRHAGVRAIVGNLDAQLRPALAAVGGAEDSRLAGRATPSR